MIEKDSEVMTKVEIMDKLFDSYQKITSFEICSIVKSIFKLDLTTKPVLYKELAGDTAKMAVDSALAQYGRNVSGAEVRKIINQFFGINLDAISSLDGSRISLFSKDQWVIRHDQDLFAVHTGSGDVDVKIFPTDYFTEQTGLKELPEDLRQSLSSMGFYYDEKIGSYYYSNPSGEAIPDAFKGQTIGAIRKSIRYLYQNL